MEPLAQGSMELLRNHTQQNANRSPNYSRVRAVARGVIRLGEWRDPRPPVHLLARGP